MCACFTVSNLIKICSANQRDNILSAQQKIEKNQTYFLEFIMKYFHVKLTAGDDEYSLIGAISF